MRSIIDMEFEEYASKSLQVSSFVVTHIFQAKILATTVLLKYPDCWDDHLQPVVELLQR